MIVASVAGQVRTAKQPTSTFAYDNVDNSIEENSINLAFTPPEEVYDVPPDSEVNTEDEYHGRQRRSTPK